MSMFALHNKILSLWWSDLFCSSLTSYIVWFNIC